MSKNFLIWNRQYREGFCVIENPENVEKQNLLLKGVTMKDIWPDDAYCKMSASYPKDIQLSDNLYGSNFAVISFHASESLQSFAPNDEVEYLQVAIQNHKGRVASTDYFIMNPVSIVDCIDQGKSGVVWNKIAKDRISSCEELVLKDAAVPQSINIFRPRFMPKALVVRRNLATHLQSQGLSCLSFTELAEYRG